MSAVLAPAASTDPTIIAVEPQLDEQICQFLVDKGRLKENDLVRGRRLYEEDASSGSLLSLLTRLGLVSERDMSEAMSELMNVPLVAPKDFPESPPPNVQLSTRFLKQLHICPISETETEVTILVANPADPYPLQAVGLATGRTVSIKLALRSEIDDLIERYYGQGRSAMGAIVENLTEADGREDDIEHLRDLASEAKSRKCSMSSSRPSDSVKFSTMAPIAERPWP
ncbi:MAG: hypothetical protein ABIR16_07540 [Dokdonella sp.]